MDANEKVRSLIWTFLGMVLHLHTLNDRNVIFEKFQLDFPIADDLTSIFDIMVSVGLPEVPISVILEYLDLGEPSALFAFHIIAS